MTPTDNLKLTYLHLMEQMRLAFDLITEHASDINARVFTLPAASNEDIGETVKHIDVTPISGEQAYVHSRQHYFKHTLDTQRSGRVLNRLPGVVCIQHPEPHDCITRLEAINQTKKEMKDLIQAVPGNKTERFETIAKILPDIVKLQVTRQLLFIDTPAKSVGFTWANRNAMQRMSKDDVLEKLKTTNEYAKQKEGLSDFYEMVQEETRIISSFKGEPEFTIRRPLRVAPMMNIHYHNPKEPIIPQRKNPANMVAHSPLLVFNHTPTIHPLEDFERPANSDQTSMTLVIPRLHLYEVSCK